MMADVTRRRIRTSTAGLQVVVKRGDLTRFLTRVSLGDDDACWEWLGATRKVRPGRGHNHGIFMFGRKVVSAHRAAWVLLRGPIPDGMQVLHHCDNPPCVRPDHLFVGTAADNVRDMDAKGRRVKVRLPGERNSQAKLTSADVAQIRELLRAGVIHREIAARFGVTRSNIGVIANGKSWSQS